MFSLAALSLSEHYHPKERAVGATTCELLRSGLAVIKVPNAKKQTSTTTTMITIRRGLESKKACGGETTPPFDFAAIKICVVDVNKCHLPWSERFERYK